MKERIDIKKHEVFISWTGTDYEIKNKIVEYLQASNISCLESDHSCSGDFEQWSKEAVAACNIFLLIGSFETFNSNYVPIEIAEYKKLNDYKNRIVPIWFSKDVLAAEPWGLKDYASAVILNEDGLTDSALQMILNKVISLNINYLEQKYRQASRTEQMKLLSLSGIKHAIDKQYDFSRLYIPRTISETDENGKATLEHKSTDLFYERDEIFFIYGPAGSGKSQYVNQIRDGAPDDAILINLPCSRLLSEKDIFTAAYNEFTRVCGYPDYYDENNFISLLNNRRVMLVFDGMDEIPTLSQKRDIISKAEAFYQANNKKTIFVFTSRSISDADLIAIGGKQVCRLLLKKLDEAEISTLSENLFVCFGKEQSGEEFFIKIQDLDEEIRSNPLLLSQLSIIYNSTNNIPETIVGIYDAITEIIFKQSEQTDNIPEEYRDMLTTDISDILKEFSKERYTLLSKGKNIEAKKIFSKIFDEKGYGESSKKRSDVLVNFLENRSIFVDGEFCHKMFLEYFAAVRYYEIAFDYYDELEDESTVETLFSHYHDTYWSSVIKMFLVKADSLIDEDTTQKLYELICSFDVCEYTLLFDTCRDLLRMGNQAQMILIADIIKKSVDGVYPPYGPLFWYVPEYELYEISLLALNYHKGHKKFHKMLALVRDVCFIMDNKYTANSITDKISSRELFECAQANLSGVRKALCELFYLGSTDFTGGDDVYPRCFNVAEAKSLMENRCGILGRMETPFDDELSLFSHEAFSELNDEFIGMVICPYDVTAIENKLTKKSCSKLTGLILSPTENKKMSYIAINRSHIRAIYIPENILCMDTQGYQAWDIRLSLSWDIVIDTDRLIYYPTSVYLPDGLTSVATRRFYKKGRIKHIYLPNSVKYIEDYAFVECKNLTEINIPEGVAKIGAGAFNGCENLETINIPESVTKIGAGAFSGCENLETINIPESVTKIGAGAFSGCENLETINIPEGVTEIAEGTFTGCRNLASINIPESVTKIGAGAFDRCSSLSSINIPEGVTEINEYFARWSSLSSINIPEGVTKIGVNAFLYCTALSSINIPTSVTEIAGGAFSCCENLEKIDIPKGVTEISKNAFNGCSSLSSINIPESVTEIAEGTFSDCRNLASINIPEGVTKIGAHAFDGCCSLSSINIPESVTEISENAFKGCSSLSSINIPENVTEIGGSAFRGCPLPEDIHRLIELCHKSTEKAFEIEGTTLVKCKTDAIEVTIPDGVTEIFEGAFVECKNLKSINFPEGVAKIGAAAFCSCKNLETINIPESVTEIDELAFCFCDNLKTINIPEGVTEIGDGAFHYCRNLKTINIPKSVTKIGEEAFSYCKALTSINIPESVTEIAEGAFYFCDNLKTINISEGVTKINKNTFKGCSSLSSINIPECVTEIGEHAFDCCRSLSSINIPKSVTEISESAFCFCDNLKTVNISEGVTIIGEEAFKLCTSLSSINIPEGVTIIGEEAFSNCKALTSINIPEGVTEIAKGTFSDCRNLASINIPEGVTKIGAHAFKLCTSLSSINIPEGVTEIGGYAFKLCTSLSSINIPDSITEIGISAFAGCSALTAIDIPSSVRIIGDEAFSNCTSLSSVKIGRRFEDDIDRIFGDIDRSIITFTD